VIAHRINSCRGPQTRPPHNADWATLQRVLDDLTDLVGLQTFRHKFPRAPEVPIGATPAVELPGSVLTFGARFEGETTRSEHGPATDPEAALPPKTSADQPVRGGR
jgi:hypothetical protein